MGGNMKYYEKLSGETVFLSPINPDDYEVFCKWNNDPDIAARTGMLTKIMNDARQKETLEYLAKTEYNFSIIERETQAVIGFCNIFDIKREDRSAEIGIMIGDKDKQNRGYGFEVGNILLKYCFDVLNLNSVSGRIASFNAQSLALCSKIGFIQVGRKRQAWYYNGEYFDEIIVDILKSEYRSMKKI